MSDRYHKLTVCLDEDYRAEDIETLMEAIRLLKGVADVTMSPTDLDDQLARMRVASDVKIKLFEAVRDAFNLAGY